MKDLNTYKNIYFLGIGGIGMSALARYFKLRGFHVAGYDKTPSPLTDELIAEGIDVHFEDLGSTIPDKYSNKDETLVVLTPAIPKDHKEWVFFQNADFTILKRAQVLGLITQQSKGIGVAGTHGKTTTSTLLTHMLTQSSVKCSAFLGGISSNYNTNFVSSTESAYTVIEADEFDRSFLQLTPFAGIITSTDADHLDIYGDASHVQEGFQLYANRINPDGVLFLKSGLAIQAHCKVVTYGVNMDAAIAGKKLSIRAGRFYMDVHFEDETWTDVELGLPGIHNAENALACIGMSRYLGLSEEEIRLALASFTGVKRRFEYHIRTEDIIYIDDYAHHPTEIAALLSSVRLMYPSKKITGIFQPHLFSRTRDFMDGFVSELSKLDELILMPIYPARELPIEGITSDEILKHCTIDNKQVLTPEEILDKVTNFSDGVILTIGAGDIDRLVPHIKKRLETQKQ